MSGGRSLGLRYIYHFNTRLAFPLEKTNIYALRQFVLLDQLLDYSNHNIRITKIL